LKHCVLVEHLAPKCPKPMSGEQVPLPSHVLLPWQTMALSVSSTPLGTGVQAPSCPGTAHELHVVQVGVPQHTRSTQFPLKQVPPLAHGAPSIPLVLVLVLVLVPVLVLVLVPVLVLVLVLVPVLVLEVLLELLELVQPLPP
jgi:hypothetical protein